MPIPFHTAAAQQKSRYLIKMNKQKKIFVNIGGAGEHSSNSCPIKTPFNSYGD